MQVRGKGSLFVLLRLVLMLGLFVTSLGFPATTYAREVVVEDGETGELGPLAPQAATPLEMAHALAENDDWVISSSMVTQPSAVTADRFTSTLSYFPTGPDGAYVALSSGDTASIPVPATHASTNLGGDNVRGDTDYDVTIWQVLFDVPVGLNCLQIDFQFFSEEYPFFVGQQYNDAFIAEWDVSDWSTSGSTISAPNNFAFDSSGNVISINSTGVGEMSGANGTGTSCDGQDDGSNSAGGGTVILGARTPIESSGLHTLTLSIFDQGDQIYDSYVLLDNLNIFYAAPGTCLAGAAQTADYGDAPAPYPTLFVNDGARHERSQLSLGASVDVEPDGQPNAQATGDDVNASDDEDGITFTSVLTPGASADISVVASGSGYLNAWFDFNADGDWADAGEQIFTDEALVAGANNLNFAVPAGAAWGSTYARFRFDSAGGLNYIGEADDGEVEDYKVVVGENAPPVLTVSGSVTYTEAEPPVVLGPGLTLTDPEDDPVSMATVSIGTGFSAAEDRLTIGEQMGTSGSVSGVSWSYNTTTGVLTLSGSNSVATYQSVLRQVTYYNVSSTPSTAEARQVEFSVPGADPGTVTVNVEEYAGAWLESSKTAQDLNGAPLYADDEILYTVVVTNVVGIEQTNVVITDMIPYGTLYVSDSASVTPGSVSGPDPLQAAVGTLAPGASATFTFRVTVDSSTFVASIENTAYAASDQQPPIMAGPVESTVTPSDQEADLAVSKSAVKELGAITYTIGVQNLGPGVADGAVVHDDIGAHIDDVTWTCVGVNGATCAAASGSGNTLDETIPSFPVGGIVTYTVKGIMPLFGDEANVVTVTAPDGITDPDTDNNTALVGNPYKVFLVVILRRSGY